MTDEILVDKRKFDAILKRMIATKPTPHKDMASQSKAKKRGKKPLPNPFKIGDKVVFDPDRRTIGLTYSSFDRLRIHPGDAGTVTKIVDGAIFIEDGRGGLSWPCFKRSK